MKDKDAKDMIMLFLTVMSAPMIAVLVDIFLASSRRI
jgi:hypothetical protein